MNIQAVVLTLLASIAPLAIHAKDIELPPASAINVNGVERKFHVQVPKREGTEPMALVFDLHGTGGTPHSQSDTSQLGPIAQREKFLVVWPLGEYPRSYSGKPSWNANLRDSKYDDVAFFKAMIAKISKAHPVDPRKIYVTGFSGGARMASRLACALPDQIAAIAPLGGLQYPASCKVSRFVPIMAIHGEQDTLVGIESAAFNARYWSERYGCAKESEKADESKAAKLVEFGGCQQGSEVLLYRVADSGHTWPMSPRAARLAELGLGKTNMKFPASEMI